ncbi:DegT/DnrJ/EryC1/StrS family aminotransferase [Neisseria sp. Ec49-e6-T10]|uniref:DegT/DnrJ/EryC1/StrS family aminotransferase n=1 Tax=Neisseria sp. Ec49-e6-T10 TaxID=3140744 RepID=UPI003EBD3428
MPILQKLKAMIHPPAPVLSATLEKDDVQLAKHWLAQPQEDWFNPATISEWEQLFAHWLGIEHTFAFAGGRAALYHAVMALGLCAESEVILPAFTCQSVVNAFQYQQINPLYADIETDTYGLDIESVKQVYTPNCKAIMLQYTFGLVSRDIEALIQFAQEKNLYIIEDCAHALGATYKDRKLGTLGDIAVFSSERSKIINTIHGGMVACQNDVLAQRLAKQYEQAPFSSPEKIKKLLNTLIQNYYIYKHPQRFFTGPWAQKHFNEVLPQMFPEEFTDTFCTHYLEKMSAPVAALSINQFQKMERFNTKRRAIAKQWDCWAEKQGYKKPVVLPNSTAVFLRYPVCVPIKMKQNTDWALEQLNVHAGVWFTSAAHPTPLFLEHCPNGTRAAQECINLPTLI